MTQDFVLEQPRHTFKLTDEFKDGWKNKSPGWNALAEVTFRRTYSRPKDDGKTENWFDTCVRVTEGTFTWQLNHCRTLNIPWNYNKAQKTAQQFFAGLFERKWTPPGRGLWTMGTDAVWKKGGAILNNCAFITTDSIGSSFSEPFTWLMDMSMLGVGVGFDTAGKNIVSIREPRKSTGIYSVADTREGWIDLIKILLESYVGVGNLPAEINYSLIRPVGEPLKTFGGTSSGHVPLKEAYDDIKVLLDTYVGHKLDSAGIVDIMNMLGKCVVAGGIRRTAEIAFGDADDDQFLSLKDPSINESALYHHRWSSNNSIFATVGMDYSKVAEMTAKNGEPGYEWLENAQRFSRMGKKADNKDYRARGGNPCLEQTLEAWEMCCLVETYPSRHDSLEDWVNTLKYAYMYAKTVTLIQTHDPRTNAVMLKNRRIGCSVSGVTQAFEKFGRRETLRAFESGYDAIQAWDSIYSDWFCVPKSIKTTSVKPSGTVSILAEVTPGVHYAQSQYYIRNVRISQHSPLVAQVKRAGYWVEPDKYSPQSVVVSFPIKLNNVTRTIDEVSMWEQLENTAQIQEHWSDNQVSVTVQFSEDEAKDIGRALELYETRLKGVSFLPKTNHGYEQAPYIPITAEEYEDMIKNVKPLDLDNEIAHEVDEKFCDTEACEI